MVKDLDKSLQPKDTYIHAENLRPVSSTDATTGILENIKGNSLITDLTGTIVGHCLIRNELIVLTYGSNNSRVYKLILDDNYNLISKSEIWSDAAKTSSNKMNFGLDVKVIGRYENDNLKKIYFTDASNNVRFFNYMDSTLSTKNPDEFELLRKGVLSTPALKSIGSGSLNTGVVQYIYKLYDLYGAETLFSSFSPLYHITSSSESSDEITYKGSRPDVNSGKSYSIDIPYTSDFGKFDRLECVAIHYSALNGVPIIRIIERVNIKGTTSSITVLDYGQSLGTYSIDEINIMTTSLFTAKELETKDNYLFAGNITEKYFDVDWDARAYRWFQGGTGYTGHNYTYLYNDATHRLKLEYVPASSSKITYTQVWNGSAWGTTSTVSGWIVPDTYNCINYSNHRFNIAGIETCQKQAQFNVLGGEGSNILYRFSTKKMTLDSVYTLNPQTFKSLLHNNSTNYYFNDSQTNFRSFASPFSTTYRSFQRDETYRFYIILQDDYGRESFPKWIGDIRIPNAYDYDLSEPSNPSSTKRYYYITSQEEGGIIVQILNVEFLVKNLPSNIKSYKITMVPRTSSDRSIVAQGLLSKANLWYDDVYQPALLPSPLVDINLQECVYGTTPIYNFISPEISFGNNVSFNAEDRIDIVSSAMFGSPVSPIDGYAAQSCGVRFAQSIKQFTANEYSSPAPRRTFNVRDQIKVNPSKSMVYLKDDAGNFTKYKNIIKWENLAESTGAAGTNIVLTLNESVQNDVRNNQLMRVLPIVNYTKNIFYTQYGGNTYNSIQLSKSVLCSNTVNVSGTAGYNAVAYGDTFIGYFDYAASMSYFDNADWSNFSAWFFVVESSINLYLREDDCTHRIYTNPDAVFMREIAGRFYKKNGGDATSEDSYYTQSTDMYKYNSVYSRLNDTKLYSPKPVDWTAMQKFPTRVKYSDLKINNEELDSWSKFRTSNYREVDSAFGNLTNLLNYNNILYFFQENAFGQLSVNPRTLIRDNNALELTLGTGGILDRHDYISNNIGNRFSRDIVSSPVAMYWYDDINKEIFRYANGNLTPLTISKGIKTQLNKYDDVSNVVSTNDRLNSEVLFCVKYRYRKIVNVIETLPMGYFKLRFTDPSNIDITQPLYINDKLADYDPSNLPYVEYIIYIEGGITSGDYVYVSQSTNYDTLVFNERLDAFTGIYTFKPYYFIQLNNNILSTDNGHSIYSHNVGNRCKFYGTTHDSTLKVLVNPDYATIKIFDTIRFYSNSSTYGTLIDELFNTWSDIRFYNDYQNTDYISLNVLSNNITRRERDWSMQIPRNKVNVNITSNPDIFLADNLSEDREFGERIRDKYMVIDLRYDNSNNNKFTSPYIITNYRYSIR